MFGGVVSHCLSGRINHEYKKARKFTKSDSRLLSHGFILELIVAYFPLNDIFRLKISCLETFRALTFEVFNLNFFKLADPRVLQKFSYFSAIIKTFEVKKAILPSFLALTLFRKTSSGWVCRAKKGSYLRDVEIEFSDAIYLKNQLQRVQLTCFKKAKQAQELRRGVKASLKSGLLAHSMVKELLGLKFSAESQVVLCCDNIIDAILNKDNLKTKNEEHVKDLFFLINLLVRGYPNGCGEFLKTDRRRLALTNMYNHIICNNNFDFELIVHLLISFKSLTQNACLESKVIISNLYFLQSIISKLKEVIGRNNQHSLDALELYTILLQSSTRMVNILKHDQPLAVSHLKTLCIFMLNQGNTEKKIFLFNKIITLLNVFNHTSLTLDSNFQAAVIQALEFPYSLKTKRTILPFIINATRYSSQITRFLCESTENRNKTLNFILNFFYDQTRCYPLTSDLIFLTKHILTSVEVVSLALHKDLLSKFYDVFLDILADIQSPLIDDVFQITIHLSKNLGLVNDEKLIRIYNSYALKIIIQTYQENN